MIACQFLHQKPVGTSHLFGRGGREAGGRDGR